METLAGKKLGCYQLLSQLGRGGMAIVYRAYDSARKRYVALKVLSPQLAKDRGFVARFRQEAHAAINLVHRNIVRVYEFGEEEGVYFLAMDYIEGETLRDRLERDKRLDVSAAAGIVSQIASALDYAHSQGVIHRDVKPSNILLSKKGKALLSDFGIAKIVGVTGFTRTGVAMGTPEYMSPEQVNDQVLDGRSDIYSLGIVVFEMLTGTVPFTGNTALVAMYKHVSAPLPRATAMNPALPKDADALFRQVLAKDRRQRFAAAHEFASALKRLDTQTLRASSTRTGVSTRIGWIAASVCAILIIIIAFALGAGRIPEPRALDVPTRGALSATGTLSSPPATAAALSPGKMPMPTLPASTAQTYLPLFVGNRWVYQSDNFPAEVTMEVVGRETVGDVSTYAVEFSVPGMAWWKDNYLESSSDQALMLYAYTPITFGSKPLDPQAVRLVPPVPVLGFDPKPGTRWTDAVQVGGSSGTASSEVIGSEQAIVRAGTFGTIKAAYEIQVPQWRMQYVRWYAAGIGIVKMEMTVSTTKVSLQLKSYK